ncbi:hypothetical protein F2Q68_00027698 [Brassica cretica]|uniref:Uncharacterized protein n=1 Tax=Brassica cretica TaxID=69181 RepID=A0A8S9ICU0_BRACR|nr:hypothetical protein F2Q68_00027698 [Brassica cretica]
MSKITGKKNKQGRLHRNASTVTPSWSVDFRSGDDICSKDYGFGGGCGGFGGAMMNDDYLHSKISTSWSKKDQHKSEKHVMKRTNKGASTVTPSWSVDFRSGDDICSKDYGFGGGCGGFGGAMMNPNFPYKNIRGISEGRLSSFQDQHKLVKKGSAQVGEARDEKICRQSKQDDKLFKPIEGL